MKRKWMVWMAAGLVLSFSCGPTRAEAGQGGQIDPDAQRIIDQQMKGLKEREAATFPCSLFPQAEIETLVGNPLDKGAYAFNNVIRNDHQYKSESCDWSAAGGDGNEVGLTVSLPKHFASGEVECEPGSDDQKTSGVGDQAWWDYQKFFGMGTLRVCSAKAMLEVKVTVTSKDQALARKIAQAMAEKVLASQ
jgi:hypothetical protein